MGPKVQETVLHCHGKIHLVYLWFDPHCSAANEESIIFVCSITNPKIHNVLMVKNSADQYHLIINVKQLKEWSLMQTPQLFKCLFTHKGSMNFRCISLKVSL